MKTERLVLLTSPEFKAFVGKEAKREGVSAAEWVRRRVQPSQSKDEAELSDLTLQLRKAVDEAQKSAAESLAEVESILQTLRQKPRAPTRRRAA